MSPAISKSQRRAAVLALKTKRWEMRYSFLFGAAKEMYNSLTIKELEDIAKTSEKRLPEKVQ